MLSVIFFVFVWTHASIWKMRSNPVPPQFVRGAYDPSDPSNAERRRLQNILWKTIHWKIRDLIKNQASALILMEGYALAGFTPDIKVTLEIIWQLGSEERRYVVMISGPRKKVRKYSGFDPDEAIAAVEKELTEARKNPKYSSVRNVPSRLVSGAADPISVGYRAAVRLEEAALWKRLPLAIRRLIEKEATSIKVIDDMFYAYFGDILLRVDLFLMICYVSYRDDTYAGTTSVKKAVEDVRRRLKWRRRIERIP